MRILLLGKNGQVGWELQRSLSPLGGMLALDSKSREYCGDLSDFGGLAEAVQRFAPDVIVNAAAYTAVDKAESDTELAFRVNVEAVAVLAREAKQLDSLLIHYPTDYVFTGDSERHWRETDAVAPLNQYGASKLAGERAIQASDCRLILRTSWVYAARSSNFAKSILRLARERDSVSVIADQFGVPTGAELLADVSAHLIRPTVKQPQLGGLYHFAASGETNWYAYARLVLERAAAEGIDLKVHGDQIAAIPSSAYPTPAKRPNNSRLDTQKLQQAFTLNLPDWQVGVERMLAEILQK